MGKLVEDDSAAAVQLLESKGLFLLPMALVDEFLVQLHDVILFYFITLFNKFLL